jgi:hypothetical protein
MMMPSAAGRKMVVMALDCMAMGRVREQLGEPFKKISAADERVASGACDEVSLHAGGRRGRAEQTVKVGTRGRGGHVRLRRRRARIVPAVVLGAAAAQLLAIRGRMRQLQLRVTRGRSTRLRRACELAGRGAMHEPAKRADPEPRPSGCDPRVDPYAAMPAPVYTATAWSLDILDSVAERVQAVQ